MNTSLKTVVLLIMIGLIIAACSKSTDPTPDVGSQVAGTYTINYAESDSASQVLYTLNLPYTVGTSTLSGNLTARRDSANAVFLTQTVKYTGQTDQTTVVGEISLRSNGTGYDMYLSSQKIGTADGKTINIDDQYTDTQTGIKYRDIITATK